MQAAKIISPLRQMIANPLLIGGRELFQVNSRVHSARTLQVDGLSLERYEGCFGGVLAAGPSAWAGFFGHHLSDRLGGRLGCALNARQNIGQDWLGADFRRILLWQ